MSPEQKRKIFIISIVIILIGIIGFLIFLMISFKPKAEITESTTPPIKGQLPPTTPGTGTSTLYQPPQTLPPSTTTTSFGGQEVFTTTIPPTGSGQTTENKINNIDQLAIKEITLSTTGGIQFYDKTDNFFYTMDDQGIKNKLSNKEFFNVDALTWSNDKNKAILYYPDNTKIVYDFKTEKQYTLPSHWNDIQFSTNNDKLVFKSFSANPENTQLAISNIDGNEAKKIEKLGLNADNAIVSWSPNNQFVGFYTEGSDSTRKKIFFIGQNGENFKLIEVEGRGFTPNWSPSGQVLVYSIYQQQGAMAPELWITDATGDSIGNNLRPLNINTYASKCVFATDKELICAVPRELPTGAGMIPSLADGSADDIYLVNTDTGSKIPLETSGRFNVSSPMYSQADHSLYFFNNFDQTLHKLEIPAR